MDRPAPPTEELTNPQDYKKTFQSRVAVSKFVDPCEAASKASMDCMERAHYNRDEVGNERSPVVRTTVDLSDERGK
jgi:cytochrome c oxidase assembly protein subunit 23